MSGAIICIKKLSAASRNDRKKYQQLKVNISEQEARFRGYSFCYFSGVVCLSSFFIVNVIFLFQHAH